VTYGRIYMMFQKELVKRWRFGIRKIKGRRGGGVEKSYRVCEGEEDAM
jgi:hypothetical protein